MRHVPKMQSRKRSRKTAQIRLPESDQIHAKTARKQHRFTQKLPESDLRGDEGRGRGARGGGEEEGRGHSLLQPRTR
eukprot:27679-Rhodomonas_salina.1